MTNLAWPDRAMHAITKGLLQAPGQYLWDGAVHGAAASVNCTSARSWSTPPDDAVKTTTRGAVVVAVAGIDR